MLAQALGAYAVPAPPPGLASRVRLATAPALERNARRIERPDWRVLVRALGAALVPLPGILLLDARLLGAAHGLLSAVLPAVVSTYLVATYAAALALLLALTYGAVPLLATRQAWTMERRHA
jgi:hypothetical protein